ncbi:hypothetical protein UlMin_006348 [Ulmus minor]
MDPEELSSLCSSLALEEDEEILSPDLEASLLAQGERSIDRSLVGCVLSTGPISRDAFVNMIKGVWKTKERFEVEAIRSNKFVFHFLSIADRRRVFSGGPWCFQNKLLVLEEPTGVGDYSKMSFSKAPFWIQLHNIPVFCMSKTVGSILGNMVGLVQEVECDQNGLCLGTFIRVRAIIDVSKPLKRILKVRLGSDKELVTILLKYEHLPELWDSIKLKYGAWIMAPTPPSSVTNSQSKRRRPISSSWPSTKDKQTEEFILRVLCFLTQMERLRSKLGYSGMLTWGREGRSGGLCLLWSDSITVQLLSGSKGHIDVVVTSPNSTCWRFTGLYGNPDTSLRPQFWDLMKRLGDSSSLPWLCGGDMNEILFDHEKKGGGDRAAYLLRNFREAIKYCNLADLGFRGPKFTWCRGNHNSNFIQERLDWMLGNSGWLDRFPNSIVHHLRLWGSDHRPLLIEVLKDGEVSSLGKPLHIGRFHFEEAWADEPECRDTILEHWREQSARNLDEVANKLHQCASDLSRWNLEKFRWLREEIKKKTIAFNQADRALSSANWRTHQRLERELEALKYKEKRYWQQRSKDTWLKSGDRNSKFFHRKALARRAKNSIVGLFDSNENWCEDKEGIAHIAESYFTNLFSSSSPHFLDMDMVLNSLEAKVSPAMNEQLDGPFVAEDVRAAVFQMAPSKSPGADGMSALFYQNYWAIVGDEVTTACLGFLNEGLGLVSINETLITLLPKVKCPTHITEFRPISLCNVLYKIISKMLATRMRSVMDSIISEEQSAFIPRRLISDNAIIGFECIHALKQRRSKQKGYLALKLDMAKAYDRVEWSFIREVMKKLGFSEGWIKKILDCVTSVYYSLLLNGEKVGCIRPSRGLRQGDPLSPYLFLLCAEGLSSLIHTFERTGQLQGMQCGTNGPTIAHLFFADDSLLFVEATPASCYAIKEILVQYETASGQLVNYSKSAVCFGPSISEEDIGRMVAILGVTQVKCHEHYLGLPCFSGKNKSKLFAGIKDRVWNKLCGWKSKLLSAGGREILTKAIIQAIPTYAMNMFRIPISLIKELHWLCAKF